MDHAYRGADRLWVCFIPGAAGVLEPHLSAGGLCALCCGRKQGPPRTPRGPSDRHLCTGAADLGFFLRSVVKTAESVQCKTLRCGFMRALECDQSASDIAFSPVQPKSSAFAPLSYLCQCKFKLRLPARPYSCECSPALRKTLSSTVRCAS